MTDPKGHPCPFCATIFPTDLGLGMHHKGPCTRNDPHPPRNKPGHVNSRCRVCSLNHTPRCVQVSHRWPLSALLPFCHGQPVALALGVERSLVSRAAEFGLSDLMADRWAVKLGQHPGNVWPDWFDAALTAVDRQFLETGWRHAWEHDEPAAVASEAA